MSEDDNLDGDGADEVTPEENKVQGGKGEAAVVFAVVRAVPIKRWATAAGASGERQA